MTVREKAIVGVGLGVAACIATSFVLERFTPYAASAGSYAPAYFLSAGILLMLVLLGLIVSAIGGAA